MENKFISFILICCVMGCSSAPRYGLSRSLPSPARLSKIKSKNAKNVKHKKLMIGISSYYADDFHGKLTANGEVYDMYGLTAAHKTLPINTIVRVTNLDNEKSLILRINDRGPYIKGRILDCSYGAAKKLGFLTNGTTKVRVEVIEWGDGEYMHHKE